MDKLHVDAWKDEQKNGSSYSLIKDVKLVEDNSLDCTESKSKRMVRKIKPKNLLTLNLKQPHTSEKCMNELFLRSSRGLTNRIPKHIVCLDEKYLRRCLEMIHISAAKAARSNLSVNLSSFQMGNFTSSKITSTNRFNSSEFVIECPLSVGTEDFVGSPAGQWVIGSITGNKSMINILKSPLFRQFGTLENDAHFGRTSLIGVEGSSCSDSMSSPGGLSLCSSQKLDKESAILRNYKYGLGMSSTNSSCSDQSSSSIFSTASRGMLQCTWNGGIPHFVFSVDGQKEVYVANLLKAESSKALDYIYLFHLSMSGQKEHELLLNESDLVGKMNVLTSFTLCPNSSRVMENEFVLFAARDNHVEEMQTSSQHIGKNKALSKKVVKVFKPSHSAKQRSISKVGRTSTIPDYCPWPPRHETCYNLDALDGSNLLDDCLPPNLELAAIVFKEHLQVNRKEAEVGGWGLKFLKKVGLKQTSVSRETSLPECCLRNTGDCSTSMDILVPASFHGGPRTRNGGPSSLTERWRSGGRCDCGGWDIGCPLTVLNSRSFEEDVLLQSDKQGECKSFDLVIQGSEQRAPTLKMVNIHDGLYFIHFQSNLSALQSFSIAVAIIHTQSPQLRPKSVQELK